MCRPRSTHLGMPTAAGESKRSQPARHEANCHGTIRVIRATQTPASGLDEESRSLNLQLVNGLEISNW